MNKTVGDLLREARNKKGLALQTIERSTGIATHNLLAIELDQFSLIDEDKLEQYLRTYADAVDLDYASLGFTGLSTPEQTVETEPEVASATVSEPVAVPVTVAPQPVSSFDELVKTEDPDYTPTSVNSPSLRRSGRTGHTEKPAKKVKFLVPILTMLGLAVLVFGGFVLYKNYLSDLFSGSKKTVQSSSSTAASSETAASVEVAPTPTTQLTVTGGGSAIDVAVATDQKPVKVEISLSGAERSWVGLSNSDLGEGGTILSSEQPTYTATVTDGATQAVLYLGITQGVTVKVNDQVLDMSAVTSTAESMVTLTIQ